MTKHLSDQLKPASTGEAGAGPHLPPLKLKRPLSRMEAGPSEAASAAHTRLHLELVV